MYQRKKHGDGASRGATLIELIFVILIIGVFVRMVTLSLFRSDQRVSLTAATSGVIRDLRGQQMKAMTGTTRTAGSYVDYSIRFEQQRYILFPGTVYTSNNPENTVVPIDTIMQFSVIAFPGATVSFARLSGDVRSYASGSDYVLVHNTQTGEEHKIVLNARGVPIVQ